MFTERFITHIDREFLGSREREDECPGEELDGEIE
jgi:hypothetical protein